MKLELKSASRPMRVKLKLGDGNWYTVGTALAAKIAALARFHEACGGEPLEVLSPERLLASLKNKKPVPTTRAASPSRRRKK